MRVEILIEEIIQEYKMNPIDLLNIGDEEAEYAYIRSHKYSYIRTVRDIINFLGESNRKKILEIGSFLGVVSVALKRTGFNVSTFDIPEYQNNTRLCQLYERNNISCKAGNLRNYMLPYENDSFEMIVMCETLEHLNFNPLPVLYEMNRVTKEGGFLYIATPNITELSHRIKLLFGKSFHNPIEDYFKQLDRNDNVIVGLHWREYCINEIVEMIEKFGYKKVKSYYSFEKSTNKIKSLIKNIIYLYRPFRPGLVIIGKKENRPKYEFWFTEANL